VVDDELNIRELVQVALRFHGFTVTTAATGSDALRQAAAGRPDLVVLDVVLPDLDGFEVCRRLRAEGNDVPVIFLTAREPHLLVGAGPTRVAVGAGLVSSGPTTDLGVEGSACPA
jgi:DNA-binding response OmpR family regulator